MNNILEFEEFLFEMKRNYKLSNLIHDCENIGFGYEETKDGFKFTKKVTDKNGNIQTIDVSCHKSHKNGGENNIIDPKTMQEIRDALIKEYQYTGDTKNIEKAPWDAWGGKKPTKEYLDNMVGFKDVEAEKRDREVEELERKQIEYFKNRLNKLKIDPNYTLNIYNYKARSGAFIGSKTERGKTRYSIFASIDDKRPLCDWYDDVVVDDTDEKLITGFGFINYPKTKKEKESGKLVVHPILEDGTVSEKTFEI